MSRRSSIIQIVISVLVLIFLINWLNYWIIYLRLGQCQWPKLASEHRSVAEPDDKPLKVMMVTDVHLKTDTVLNVTENVWREWQMYWTFRLAKERFRPHVILILGDLFDDGVNYDQQEFDSLVQKFERIFTYDYLPTNQDKFEATEEKPIYFTIHGNHDIGFHYEMTPDLKSRFEKVYNLADVQHLAINGIRFVAVNSVTMEGDYCQLCARAVRQLHEVSDQLCPRHDKVKQCLDSNRPILLTHYPLYRESEEKCGDDWDTRAWRPKYDQFIENADCLSWNASHLVLDSVRPRLAFSGHTHVSCQTRHFDGTEEWTIASFNYRYLYTPTILLAKLTKTDHSIAKCILTHEFTFYLWDTLLVIVFAILVAIKRLPHKMIRKSVEFYNYLKVHSDKCVSDLVKQWHNYSKNNTTRTRRPS